MVADGVNLTCSAAHMFQLRDQQVTINHVTISGRSPYSFIYLFFQITGQMYDPESVSRFVSCLVHKDTDTLSQQTE